jgi:cystathionine beta-lyase
MGTVDFDTPVDRAGTSSLKWNRYGGNDILPMWVADMDFRSPQPVIDALKARADHGVFGYTEPPKELVDVALQTLFEAYSWTVQPDWLLWLPGVVPGLNASCRMAGDPGDEVIVMPPVYPPFLSAPAHTGRRCVAVPLKKSGGGWSMDLAAIEAAVTPRTRLLMLCSPHNPVGRVFTRKELAPLARLCRRHDLLVCSDEIHSGLVLDPEKRHLPFALLDDDAAARSITLMAPSKTFNLPGLGCAFAVIPDPEMRRRFAKAAAGLVPDVNLMGYTAALAAYRDGGPWLSELLTYLRENRDRLMDAVNTLPGLSMSPVEATYLAWIDTRSAGIEAPAAFFEKAGVGLSDGTPFGGRGYLRLNFGCSRSRLNEAVARMTSALDAR